MATEAVRVRPETKTKLQRFAKPRRLKLVEVADLAIDALAAMPKDQQDALIERRDAIKSEPTAA
jgi:hypothetical protein